MSHDSLVSRHSKDAWEVAIGDEWLDGKTSFLEYGPIDGRTLTGGSGKDGDRFEKDCGI